ncbi:hypothetical protein [Sphingomonas soli]|uniref:hypothetical protein n=1 Tax=Sphingomonas soli TaxID=266127 RepID=UPI00082AEB89|nr:hypothetical protein [Sphingomonas soli]
MTRTNGKAFWAYLAADAVVIAFLRFFRGLNVVAGGAGVLAATLVVSGCMISVEAAGGPWPHPGAAGTQSLW